MADIKLAVNGMTCGGCVAAVKQALEGVTGVTAAEVDLDKAAATVSTGETAVAVADLVMAVKLAGYEAKEA